MGRKNTLAIFGGKPVRNRPFPAYPVLGKEEEKAVVNVIKSGRLSTFAASRGKFFLGGAKIQEFEKMFADYHNVKYAICVNSATAGLHVALAACGIGPGDEVIVPPYTFTATATSVLMHNAIPVFADIELSTYCIDPEDIEKKITRFTKAIVPVHLLGHPAEMEKIMNLARKYKLKVIEDNAQSPGARYKNKLTGTIGDMGVFSFQETKNLAIGEGGMIITNNKELAERSRMLRNHGEAVIEGQSRNYLSNIVGWNYRMTEVEAAIGIEQLRKFDALTNKRIKLAQYLRKGLTGMLGINISAVKPYVSHVFHVVALEYDENIVGVNRATFVKALIKEGIPVTMGYPRPLYENPIFKNKVGYGIKGCPFKCAFYKGKVEYKKGLCPITENLCNKKAIWIFVARPPATLEDMDDIIKGFHKVYNHKESL